jgi:hypothetical protein
MLDYLDFDALSLLFLFLGRGLLGCPRFPQLPSYCTWLLALALVSFPRTPELLCLLIRNPNKPLLGYVRRYHPILFALAPNSLPTGVHVPLLRSPAMPALAHLVSLETARGFTAQPI